jgi:CYTH domain-containing protein
MNRVAGEGRYAHVEREQRWLLSEVPPGVSEPIAIFDLYITGTRLRLRRMAGPEVVFKLGQKVRPVAESPEVVHLTNMYLSEAEHATLVGLGGAELHKTRWHGMHAGRRMAVDEFHGHLAGLVLAEVELEVDEPRLAMPSFALAEVTDDDRYSGGSLAASPTSPASPERPRFQ